MKNCWMSDCENVLEEYDGEYCKECLKRLRSKEFENDPIDPYEEYGFDHSWEL